MVCITAKVVQRVARPLCSSSVRCQAGPGPGKLGCFASTSHVRPDKCDATALPSAHSQSASLKTPRAAPDTLRTAQASVLQDLGTEPTTTTPSGPFDPPGGLQEAGAVPGEPRGQDGDANEAPLAFLGRRQLRDREGRLLLKNLSYPELEAWCLSTGERPQRARQLWRWMYHDKAWARSIEATADLTNGFGAPYREKVKDVASIDGGMELTEVQTAADGTRKLLFKLTVGCAMNCQFCLTGRMGLMANLSTAQIVEQVVEARRIVGSEGGTAALTNVVFMGMGEPLQNLEAVLAALPIICHPLGLHFGTPRVTVSTVGLVPQIHELCSKSQVALAVSLHASTDIVRDWIAPVNRRWPLSQLLGALQQIFPRGGDRSVFIEYVMLKDVNDTLADAHRLVDLLHPIQAKVNLIGFNAHEGTRFLPSSHDQILAFRSILIQAGRVCTVRESRGDDEMAACGQLGVDQERLAPTLRVPQQFEAALSLP